jgi:hypothetical protein
VTVATGHHDASTVLQSLRRTAGPLTGLVAWVVHLGAIYVAESLVCRNAVGWTVLGLEADDALTLLLTLVTAVPTAIALALAVRAWRAAGSHGVGSGATTRTGVFLSLSGIILNGVFLWAIVLEGTTVLFLGTCE